MIARQPRLPVPSGPADVVLYNGNVVTVDAARPRAQAVAIRGNQLLAVGDNADVRALAGSHTEQVDLGGRSVLPGLIDSHAHAWHVGHELAKVDLSRCRTVDDVLKAVAERARTTPKGQWIQVSGMWHETALAEKRLPHRRELDAVAPDHPVYLPRGTRFFAVANSLALKLAGIDESVSNPEGGEFVRDPQSGELTGLMLNPPAFGQVRKLLPGPGADHHVEAVHRAGRMFSRTGVTSLIDPALSSEAIRAYQQVWAAGELKVRTNMTYILDMNVPVVLSRDELLAKLDSVPFYSGFGDDLLRMGPVKMFTDGFVETAWLKEPYANNPSFHGVQAVERDVLFDVVRAANRAGWQVGVHAVGDAAVELALDAFEAADRERSIRDKRWSLMHAVFATPESRARAREMGVIISAQQLLVYAFAPTMLACWGQDRMRDGSPHRTFLDEGLVLAAGSDVVPFDPLIGIWSMVTRGTLAAGVVGPEQRVSRAEALHAYTLAGAYLTFEEERKGSLVAGKLADLVVLHGDPMTCPEDQIKDLPISATVMGGAVTFSDGRVWGNRTE